MESNSLQKPVVKLPPRPPASLPEEIFRARQRKEISQEECDVGLAVWTAENLGKFRPRLYLRMPETLVAYVRGRVGNTRERGELGAQLGEWTHTMRVTQGENAADLAVLIRSREICASVKLTKNVNALDQAIHTFQNWAFPHEIYNEALRAQAIDSADRRRKNRD